MTNEPSIWSDTPPSEAGDYHIRNREFPHIVGVGELRKGTWYDTKGYQDWMEDIYEFGPRVLSAEETVALTAEVERLRAELAESKRAWGIA